MSAPPILPSHAAELRSSLGAVYDVAEKDVHVNGSVLRLLKVHDTNTLVDAIAPEEFAGDERLPYWAEIWPSSIVLAQICLARSDLRGKRVLELGCGVGLAGIAAARSGAHVTLSDYENDALEFSRYNTLTNLSDEERGRVEFHLLDWRKVPPINPFDVLLAADCVYERRNFFPLTDVLSTLLKPDGFALFTEPGRSIGAHFFSLLQEAGFDVQRDFHPAQSHGKDIDVVQATIRRDASSRGSTSRVQHSPT